MFTIIAASSLSADYAPKADRDGSEQEAPVSASAESDALAAKRRTEASQGSESVFGDYEEFDDEELIDDEDLIDDTSGVDPAPVDDETWTTTSETAPQKVSETIIERPKGESRLTPVSRKRDGNPLQRQATPEDAKRQAAQLAKLRRGRKPD